MTSELVINALLAGFWAGAAILAASNQPISKALVFAAGVAALRAAIGYISARFGKPVPVDK